MSRGLGDVYKRQVRRNRVKRVLREFFRLHQGLVPPGMDIVVVPKRQLRPERVTLAFVRRDLLPVVESLRGAASAGLPGARA